MSKLRKPRYISSDKYRSAKWNELVRGRSFDESDVPALQLLVSWHQIVDQCMEDIATTAGVRVSYKNEIGDLKAMPQLATMKQASAEIRALNKQLGINDEAKKESNNKKASVLSLVVSDRKRKAEGG